MTEPITTVKAAVAALGALPMPVGPVPLSEARLAEYADIDFTELMDADAAAVIGRMRNRLVDEIRRQQAELESAREHIAFQDRNTLPELHRTIEHHKAGKERWRKRAEKAEVRVRELERPAVEAKRNEIRDSYSELISACEETKDHEGAFDVRCRLQEREEQWQREDEGATR